MDGLTELAGKRALVTGGAKRLGAAVIRRLAALGVHGIIHYRSSADEARALAAELESMGVDATLVSGDLAEPETAREVWAAAVDQVGVPDILINSASIFPEGGLDDLTVDSLAENLRVNSLSPFYLAQCFAQSGARGCIVNFTDTMVRDYDRKHVPYHISKRVLHDLTRVMAVEYGPRIRVNAVAPGLVLPPEGEDESYLEGLKHSNLLETYGSAEQVAHAVEFLVTNEFITGQTIYVDGGRNLRGSMYE
jgi:NAD(P)-dependent dehydrogenase (short-subunit alcohol dehydrogenase family)